MILLSNRQNEILKLIIEEYSKVPIPVGSKSICDKLNISSATVRSEMAKLEEIGYNGLYSSEILFNTSDELFENANAFDNVLKRG